MMLMLGISISICITSLYSIRTRLQKLSKDRSGVLDLQDVVSAELLGLALEESRAQQASRNADIQAVHNS